jgi:hypothetical protein
MKSAVVVFSPIVRALVRSTLLIAALAATGASAASAQSSAAPAVAQDPPLAVSGWRYEQGAADLHVFHCEAHKCGAGSRVSYKLFAPGKPMTLAEFRRSQEQIAKALEQRTSGLKSTIIAVDGDEGIASPRMLKARRLTVAPSGANEYVVSALLFGGRASASVISSSREEKVSNDNYAQFALAMMTLIQTPATR